MAKRRTVTKVQKWEHLITGPSEGDHTYMGSLGELGWELVGVVAESPCNNETWFLKRPKK